LEYHPPGHEDEQARQGPDGGGNGKSGERRPDHPHDLRRRAIVADRRDGYVEHRLQRGGRLKQAEQDLTDLGGQLRQPGEASSGGVPAVFRGRGGRGGDRARGGASDLGKTELPGELGEGERIHHAAGDSALHDDVADRAGIGEVAIAIFSCHAAPRSSQRDDDRRKW
jgi:hypothetical protein